MVVVVGLYVYLVYREKIRKDERRMAREKLQMQDDFSSVNH
jgi:hypothetical protein